MSGHCTGVQANGFSGGGHQQGGGTWKKVFLITGLGCAVLVLVGALLTGLGTFRVVTCCIEHGEKQEYVRQASLAFSEAVHEAQYDRAHRMLHESTQDQWSRQDFAAQMQTHGLSDKPPFPVDTPRHVDRDDENRWYVDVHFAEPSSDEVLILTLVVEDAYLDVEKPIETMEAIVDWEFETETRILKQDSYVRAAINFHQHLRRENFEQARNSVSMGANWRGQDLAEFTDHVQPLAEELGAIEYSEVYGLYPEDQNRMRVRLLLTDSERETYFIDYYVQRFLRSVSSVSEIMPAPGASPIGMEPTDPTPDPIDIIDDRDPDDAADDGPTPQPDGDRDESDQ